MSNYGEWCPKCSAEIGSVTRGIPSMGTCKNGHTTDRRDTLRREPRADLTPPAADYVAGLRDALERLHHAVCGETGFAKCVRDVSGIAYPWPALDAADAAAVAALAARPAPQPAAMKIEPLGAAFDAAIFSDVESLYETDGSPQPAADTRVVVKPLVWLGDETDCYVSCDMGSVSYELIVSDTLDRPCDYLWAATYHDGKTPAVPLGHGTFLEAQTAAQAHHENRIGGYLAARPAPQPAAMKIEPLGAAFDAAIFSDVESLYETDGSPQPAADTRVVVKPLVWVPEDAPCTRFKAEALGGHMMIVELDPKTDPGKYSVGFDLGGLCFKFVLAEYDDFPPKYTAPAKFDGIEAAKAAAQADYETRILSAIIGTATPAQSDKIAEAAQVIIAKWDADTKTGLVYGPNEFAVMLRALAGKGE